MGKKEKNNSVLTALGCGADGGGPASEGQSDSTELDLQKKGGRAGEGVQTWFKAPL